MYPLVTRYLRRGVSLIDWPKYGYTLASEYRSKIVLTLTDRPKTPKQIANETGLYLSHVSSTLSDLCEKGIVRCLTPALRRGKIFELTEDGKQIAKKLGDSNIKKSVKS